LATALLALPTPVPTPGRVVVEAVVPSAVVEPAPTGSLTTATVVVVEVRAAATVRSPAVVVVPAAAVRAPSAVRAATAISAATLEVATVAVVVVAGSSAALLNVPPLPAIAKTATVAPTPASAAASRHRHNLRKETNLLRSTPDGSTH
jgi:hypothetical protein